MAIELKVPSVGESITEVEIGAWLKNTGETVRKDEPLVSLESEKATVELPAPETGVISQILKQKGEVAKVGEVIGYLERDGQPASAAKSSPSTEATGSSKTSPNRIMPAAAQALAEHGLSAEEVQATGPGGRLLKEDVLRHLGEQSPGPSGQPLKAEAAQSVGTNAKDQAPQSVPEIPLAPSVQNEA